MVETLVATPDEDGRDQQYIDQGIRDAQQMLEERELQVGVGDFVIQPVAFAIGALGAVQGSRRHVGINRGGLSLHKRHLIDYTPARARHIATLN